MSAQAGVQDLAYFQSSRSVGNAPLFFRPDIESLRAVAPHIGAIYLIGVNPTLGFNGPQCLAQNRTRGPLTCRSTVACSQYDVAALLKDATSAHRNTHCHWLETSSFVCPSRECDALRDNVVAFQDSQHLTASFTALAAAHFLRQIEQYESTRP